MGGTINNQFVFFQYARDPHFTIYLIAASSMSPAFRLIKSYIIFLLKWQYLPQIPKGHQQEIHLKTASAVNVL